MVRDLTDEGADLNGRARGRQWVLNIMGQAERKCLQIRKRVSKSSGKMRSDWMVIRSNSC